MYMKNLGSYKNSIAVSMPGPILRNLQYVLHTSPEEIVGIFKFFRINQLKM